LPFPEPNRLVGLWQTAPGVNIKDLNASLADYVTYREESKTFADVALWRGQSMTVTEFAEAERVDGISMTFRLLPLLGINPVLGRGFIEKDSETKSPDVIMLGYGYWQRRYGGDPNVIGRRIMADGEAREIVGVLPKDFWFMDTAHDVVAPIRFDRSSVRLAGYNFQAVARLRAGVTIQDANSDVARMIGLELGKFPPPNGMSTKMMEDARLGPNVRLLTDDLLGDIGRSLWVVMATIGIVLLIACANVANLLLVRAEGRAQELAVRAVLGAGRGRLAREMFVESLALALMGGLAGIGFAYVVVKLVLKTQSDAPAQVRANFDRRNRRAVHAGHLGGSGIRLRRDPCAQECPSSSCRGAPFGRPQLECWPRSESRSQYPDSHSGGPRSHIADRFGADGPNFSIDAQG
jgi:hypothetical protein